MHILNAMKMNRRLKWEFVLHNNLHPSASEDLSILAKLNQPQHHPLH
jgi:hypothetical protein